MVDIKRSPGTFTFTASSPSGTFSSGSEIPIQTLSIETVRVEFDTAADALACKRLYLEVPWTSTNHLIDKNIGRNFIPFFLNNAAVTLNVGLNRPVYLSTNIPPNFQFNIWDDTFNAPTGFVSLDVCFAFDLGASL